MELLDLDKYRNINGTLNEEGTKILLQWANNILRSDKK